jgi:hypothetical protein
MSKREKLKPVVFNFTKPETREARIEVPGFEPFTIRFRVPDGLASVGAKMTSIGGRDSLAHRGELAVRFTADHLEWWSLPQEPGFESLVALAKGCEAAFWKISATIVGAGDAAKN